MDDLHLIVGLGNPGQEYARTRHNAGFLAVERWAQALKADWRMEARFEARVARAALGERRVWLAEPQTFMNLSGSAVAAIARFHRLEPGRLLIVVDDADLPLGELRMRPGGSPGGHHGLESVEQHLGTREYPRLRIGIGRREAGVREITGHVLGRFARAEEPLLEKVLAKAADQLECWVRHGIGRAMNQFNGAVEPQEPKNAE